MSTRLHSGDGHPRADGDRLGRLESALAVAFRWGNLPATQRRVLGRAGIELEPASYAILARIDDLARPPQLKELAASLGVEPSTASRQVARLVDGGYVEREADPNDGRCARLRLTPTGAEVLERARLIRVAAVERVFADWDPADIDALARGLERLVSTLIHYVNLEPTEER